MKEKGFVLVTGLMFMFLIMLLGVTAMTMITSELKATNFDSFSKKAFFIADSGTEEARSRLALPSISPNSIVDSYPTDLTWKYYIGDMDKCVEMGFISTDTKNFQKDRISISTPIPFTVMIEHKKNGSKVLLLGDVNSNGIPVENTTIGNSIYVITSRGEYQGKTKVIKVEVTRGTSSLFDSAIFGGDKVTLTGNIKSDSYNSNNAPWASWGKFKNGDIGTNSILPRTLKITGNETIYGNLVVGPGGNPTVVESLTGNITITEGSVVEKFLRDMTPPQIPFGGSSLTVNLGGNNNQTINPGTYSLLGFSANGNNNVTINGDVTLIIHGSLAMSGNSGITIPNGSSLKIYVTGSFNLQGNGLVNNTGKPEKCQIFSSSTSETKFGGNHQFHGAIYAPSSDVSFVGNSDAFGSFIGKTFTNTGNGNIHYDEALSQIQTPGNGPFKILRWSSV
jgi:hypothetical protein